jgi:Ca-activated chloride channel family protein
MKNEAQCGLFAGKSLVPLEGVRIEARLSGACVEVTVTQRYRNLEKSPVEAVYVFPLEERAAVCGFAAVVGGKTIHGQVEERDAAFAKYDDAMARGDGAFLLDQERPNVFTASVGNLRAGEAVELQIRYVALATREGDAIRFSIPTTVSPRYVPKRGPEVGQPDGERVNPPHWPVVGYGLSLRVHIAGDRLAKVESPSHPTRATFDDAGATVELAREETALDRDFVLLVERRDAAVPEARVAREADGRRVAMVTLLPRFEAKSHHGHEVLFLLDCSGSMQGESIEQARRALSLCVRALQPGDTFNVMRFGSHHQSLWGRPKPYDDDTLDEATKYIAASSASLGGTEILSPLRALLEGKLDEERPRRVLLLTDGQVSNEDEVLALARKHADTTRVFTFGIGAGSSEHLVRGTARASRGASEMIFPGERIEPKVLRQFERVRMPAYDDARVDWKGLRVEQAPSRLPPLFACDALTIFARIESGATDSVELTVGEHRFTVPIDLERADAGGPIPVLWAREAILELDDTTMRRGSAQQRPEADGARRTRLLELGKRYGLMSSATSYVAVEERPSSEQVTERAELRKIPVAVTNGWGGSSRPALLAGAAPPMMRTMAVAGGLPPPAARMSAPAPAGAPYGFFARARAAVFGAPSDASSMRESASSSEKSDALYDVLMTQRASGSFTISDALVRLLGDERAEKLRAALAGADEAVVVTSLLVAFLEREHSDRDVEWRPAVTKAKAWLAKQNTSFDPTSLLA